MKNDKSFTTKRHSAFIHILVIEIESKTAKQTELEFTSR